MSLLVVYNMLNVFCVYIFTNRSASKLEVVQSLTILRCILCPLQLLRSFERDSTRQILSSLMTCLSHILSSFFFYSFPRPTRSLLITKLILPHHLSVLKRPQKFFRSIDFASYLFWAYWFIIAYWLLEF